MALKYRKIAARSLHFTSASPAHPADTFFHFSLANYYNPLNTNFGALRVLSDDDVIPHNGCGKHRHRNMEIVSYVVCGRLTHWDSATNVEDTLGQGHVQTVSMGSPPWVSAMP